MMRLLYVIDSLAAGGAETSMTEMAAQLVESGLELHVLPLSTPLDLQPRLEASGATVHSPAPTRGRRQFVIRTNRLIRAIRPDLVHTTLFESDNAGRVAAAINRIPSSTTWASTNFRKHAVGASEPGERRSRQVAAYAVDRATSRLARRFHAVSTAVAKEGASAMGVKPSKIDVIPRGRDPQRFPFRTAETRALVRRELGVSPATRVILAVGRHETVKSIDTVISATTQLHSQGADVLLLVAGRDGRVTSDLLADARRSPADVRFLGHRTDIPNLMTAADVLAFPSEREGSPGTLIEAMAVGLPIVASDIPPCREVLGGWGQDIARLIPVRDVHAFAAALGESLSDTIGNEARTQRGRHLFEQRYTIEAVGAQMADFFRLTSEPRATTASAGRRGRGRDRSLG